LLYGKWTRSHPFDIGATTRKALFKCDPANINYRLAQKAADPTSESNGSLMRITPLAIFCQNLTDEQIELFVTEECKMTHK